ncbi:hypothetical protein UlMin_022873 [Ulmus minor]
MGGKEKSQSGIDKFRGVVDLCQLHDLGFEGDCFTWRGKRDNQIILEHLDRCLDNFAWMDAFPGSKVTHLNFWCFDHYPLLINLKSPILGIKCGKKKRRGRFHFEQAWSKDPECGEIITSSYIEACSFSLSSWGRNKFRHLKKDIKALKDQIGCFSASLNPDAWLALKNNENKLNDLLLKEETYWRQRSRVSWLKDGDRNTKFFHRKASNRRSNNEILGLFDAVGCWQDDLGVVKGIIGDYFSNILKYGRPSLDDVNLVVDAIPNKVSNEINNDLDCPFIVEEIYAAVFSMNPTKAPGYEGMPALFF